MIDVITKIFCALLCGFTITYLSIKFGKINSSLKTFIISTILIGIIIYFSYQVNYKSEVLILKIILFVFVLKYVFNLSIFKSLIIILMTIVVTSICEIISSIILIRFVTIEDVRTNIYCILICNIMICILMILIGNIKYLPNKVSKFINKMENKNKVATVILFTLSVFIMTYLFYNISVNYGWNEKYMINIIIMISYIIISIIFFKDKLQYSLLEEKYDALFDYFSEIAETIDDLHLTTHEYKNQIAIVSNYINNGKYKKAKDYIESMAISINNDENLFVNLTDLPTGGLKGLLYYKIIVAKRQKIDIVLDVSKNIKQILNKLTEKEIKIITRIIGVYIDNAVSESNKKVVNIEIYNIDNELYFTISNKINKNIDIDKVGKKGFTTKGKGHGNGLYLTNRLINRNNWLKNEHKIINNYYVTKLIVDTKNIG